MNIYKILRNCTGFQWDEHNIRKNWEKHQVTPVECEQIFFNQPLVAAGTTKHAQDEIRFYALGHTDTQRKLFAVFTIRGALVRIISMRDMSKKEREHYEKFS
ncbi:MAG: BrnT family toxin [Phycisphaerae bacterium]|nr:BrnT family toxin [Phycisphaerae bacterium]